MTDRHVEIVAAALANVSGKSHDLWNSVAALIGRDDLTVMERLAVVGRLAGAFNERRRG